MRPTYVPRSYYGGLFTLLLMTAAFDAYHVGRVVRYAAGHEGVVRPPFVIRSGTAVVAGVQPEAERAGVREGDTLLDVNGHSLTGSGVLDGTLVQARPGATLDVRVATGGQAPRNARIALLATHRDPADNWYSLTLIGIVLPILCQLLGFWMVASRPADPRAWLLLMCSLGFGVRIVLTTEFREPTWFGAYALAYRLPLVETYFGWLLWLMLRFPNRHAIDARLPLLKWALLAPLATLTGLYLVFQEAAIFDTSLASTLLPAATVARTMLRYTSNTCFGLSIVMVGVRFFTETAVDARRRLRLFFAGTLMALVPSELLVQLGRLNGRGVEGFPWSVQLVCLLMMLLFPVTVAYTIVVPRAPDVGAFVRDNLRRLFLRHGAVTIQAVLALIVLALLTGPHAGEPYRAWVAAALLSLLLLTSTSLFPRSRIWMDRHVFGGPHELEAALQHVETLATDFLDSETLLERTRATLENALDAEWVSAISAIDGAATPGTSSTAIADRIPEGSLLARRLAALPTATTTYFDDEYSWVHELPADERSWLQTIGPDVVVPIVDGTRLRALICLGSKPLQAPYSDAELAVLTHVARQTSLAMKNSDLLAQMSAEVAVRERIKQEKETAEAASQAKSDFLASMSHELRTPMNAIIGYSEMLIEDAEERGSEETAADLRRILSAGKHLLELINSVLDIAKIEAGKMEVFVEPFAVDELVQGVAQIVTPLVAKGGNTLVVKMGAGVGQMRSDRTKLRQSLFNLVSNASKFTTNGTITIDVSREFSDEQPWVVVVVTDTGIGMTRAQVAKLFQPFTQADPSVASKHGGTGLGLSITKQFSEMLGGSIHVETEPGKGTSFTIRLPADAPTSERPEQRHPEPPTGVDGPVILVIDDDPIIHDQLRRSLSKAHVNVASAFDGERGLELAEAISPRAILLDVLMTGTDGWRVLARLKSNPRLVDIPVIMMTVVDQKNAGYALGADEYLVKPVGREQLSDIVAHYCSRPSDGPLPRLVLIVDDEPHNRRTLRRMLESLGCEVTEASDGSSALAAVAAHRPRLILLDLVMPGMDGFAFMDEIRRQYVQPAIPIVVVTAKDLTQDERRRLSGAVVHIVESRGADTDTMLAQVSWQVLKLLKLEVSPESP